MRRKNNFFLLNRYKVFFSNTTYIFLFIMLIGYLPLIFCIVDDFFKIVSGLKKFIKFLFTPKNK
ncbi:hypothetical protein CWO85_02560 [Candidatus Phytoplasma ziziphi]|uniref:Uncharacterized protein n=1 Tax=Ziziphus jujuba witches'-broom phytoplasma TaxID=135727 RepID=A0A660HMU4_ZIZJU|nr:hypothetical protein CWO85_02560 [Candidatus Phytoplasma ziziphi]